LKAIKHCTTRGVLFPNIVWFKINFCAEQKKIYAAACSMFAMSIANELLIVLTTRWQKAKALVVEHFKVCCTLCSLQRFLEMYLRASAVQVVTSVIVTSSSK
jgi:hypothetical protein